MVLAESLSDDSIDSEDEEELLRQQEQEIARRERSKKTQEAAQDLQNVDSDEEEARRAEQKEMISLLRKQDLLYVKGLHSGAQIPLPRYETAMSLQSQAGDLCRDARLELLDSVTASPERRNFRVSLTPLTLQQHIAYK